MYNDSWILWVTTLPEFSSYSPHLHDFSVAKIVLNVWQQYVEFIMSFFFSNLILGKCSNVPTELGIQRKMVWLCKNIVKKEPHMINQGEFS